MKKILLLGASSNIGFNFIKNYYSEFNIISLSRTLPENNQFNIIKNNIKIESIAKIIDKEQPDFVINCIAMGNVDLCESNKKEAIKINFSFVKDLVQICLSNKNIKLIHFSSNAIYSGENPYYSELSKPEPINYYGHTKKLADTYIKENLDNYLILRPISIYGTTESFQRNNPVNWLLNQLLENNKVSLVSDVFNNMLFVEDASKALRISIINNINGELNLSSNKSLSLFEIGLLMCKILKLDSSLITRVDSSFLEKSDMAPRPKNTSFDNSLAKAKLNMNFINMEDGIMSLFNNKN